MTFLNLTLRKNLITNGQLRIQGFVGVFHQQITNPDEGSLPSNTQALILVNFGLLIYQKSLISHFDWN